MNLIKDLREEYDRRIKLGDTELPCYGYESSAIRYAIDIDINGNVLDIIKLGDTDSATGKEIPFIALTPDFGKRGSGMKPHFIADFSKYIFGKQFKKGKKGEEDIIADTKKAFVTNKELHTKYMTEILESQDDDFATAIINYFENFENQDLEQFDNYNLSITDGGKITFRFMQELAVNHDSFNVFWNHVYSTDNFNSNKSDVCCAEGVIAPVAILHSSIGAIQGNTSTCLVTTNQNVIESYGISAKNTGEISVECQFKYSAMLKYFFRNRQNHVDVMQGGNKKKCVQKIIYWSEEEDVMDMFSLLVGNKYSNKALNDTVKAFFAGKCTDLSEIKNSKLHVVGLSNHSSRLVVDFYYVEESEKFFNIMKEYNKNVELSVFDFKNNAVKKFDSVSASKLLQECFVDGNIDTANTEYHYFLGKLIGSVINGTDFPAVVYDKVLNRIYHERNKINSDSKQTHYRINTYRVALIKAVLMKNYNRSDIMSELNENNKSVAYLMGRAFSMYERCVYRGMKAKTPDVDYSKVSNVVDSKFSMMMTRPKMALEGIGKSFRIYLKANEQKNINYIRQSFSDIMYDIAQKEIPRIMNKEQRGEFVLGYFQQNSFKSVDKKEKE